MTLRQHHWWLALVATTLTRSACAALGGDISTVDVDRVHMKAAHRVVAGTGASTGAGYTVHELTAPTGTAIREYVRTDGKVFAVSWSGPVMPDLRQLLGPYFTPYTTDTGADRDGHSHRTVQRPELVVHSSGRMRAFSGKAYVPAMIPTGVVIDDLR